MTAQKLTLIQENHTRTGTVAMPLCDQFNRTHDYLRISLTDACNFRCIYCMPFSNTCVTPSPALMNADEILSIASVFADLGVVKLRLTGGEPLIRKDFKVILQNLCTLPVKLALTTNGAFIENFINDLVKAKIFAVNISFDSLNPDKFFYITKEKYFNKVLSGIHLLLHHHFHVKLNCVLMRGVNDDEINDFIELTRHYPVHVRFIEYMPFEGNNWEPQKVVGLNEILEKIRLLYPFEKLPDSKNSTARKFQVKGFNGTFAVISTVSEPFCSSCNRLRLTADGKLRNCLFATGETDLLTPFRKGEDIRNIIRWAVYGKNRERGGRHFLEENKTGDRRMAAIGG